MYVCVSVGECVCVCVCVREVWKFDRTLPCLIVGGGGGIINKIWIFWRQFWIFEAK